MAFTTNSLHYHDLEVQDPEGNIATIHYIEAGDPRSPHLVLLHGFPSSSNTFRDLIPMLSDSYHILAPDYPGFGLTKVHQGFNYTFSNVARAISSWLVALGVRETAIYGHAYGGPVGLRMALANEIECSAFILQNGNVYDEGLNHDFWSPIMQLWKTENSAEVRKALANGLFNLDGAKTLYQVGTPDADVKLLNAQAWTIDYLQNLAGQESQEHQLDLLYDFRTNVQLYPDFQEYLRKSKVPVLILFGASDPAFTIDAATSIKKDVPNAVIKLFDAGHFALETKRWEIARIIRVFLTSNGF